MTTRATLSDGGAWGHSSGVRGSGSLPNAKMKLMIQSDRQVFVHEMLRGNYGVQCPSFCKEFLTSEASET